MSRAQVLIVVALAGSLAACTSSSRGSGGSGSGTTSAFKQAQAALDTARTAALTDVKAVTDAATAVDAMEPAAAKGDVDSMRTLGPAAKTASAAVVPVLGRLGTDADAYEAALTAIETSAASFSGSKATAVANLLTDARAEETATRAVGTAFAKGWPGYQGLEDVGQLWLTRAVAGYYPDPAKGGYSATIAASNFQIMMESHNAALTADRNSLSTAIGMLDTAATSKALTAVTSALNG